MINKTTTLGVLKKADKYILKNYCKDCIDGCMGCDFFIHFLYPVRKNIELIELEIEDEIEIKSMFNFKAIISVDNSKIVTQMINRYIKWCKTNGRQPEIKLNGEIVKL